MTDKTEDITDQVSLVCSSIEQLIKSGRIEIVPYTYPGRGWVDIRVYIDGKCVSDKGCAM